jgi:hypothetical protein
MSNIMHDITTLNTPAWAEKTHDPEDGYHEGHVTVGPVTLMLGQNFGLIGHHPEPIHVWIPEVERLESAQACRDLAAALVGAAEVIDNA